MKYGKKGGKFKDSEKIGMGSYAPLKKGSTPPSSKKGMKKGK